ncbi:MAG TPA: hypothetical protein VLN72_07735 [Gillisia sp.]|nr:hypothetical protein [Gillisia sp.]
MNNFRIFSITILFVLYNHQLSLAQQARDSITTYTWFDGMVGKENTNLINGLEYIEQHVTVNNKQKFLASVLFLPGSVIYQNEPYFNVELKYNVYDDLLLVKNIRGEAVILHKNRIKSFKIADHSFTHIRDTLQGNASGFFELLLDAPQLSLLKKHKKKQKKFLDRSFTYFEFTEDTPHYVLYHNRNYFPANTRREILRVFPEKAGEIRKFYRSHRKVEKNNKDQFMLQLLQDLNVVSLNMR